MTTHRSARMQENDTQFRPFSCARASLTHPRKPHHRTCSHTHDLPSARFECERQQRASSLTLGPPHSSRSHYQPAVTPRRSRLRCRRLSLPAGTKHCGLAIKTRLARDGSIHLPIRRAIQAQPHCHIPGGARGCTRRPAAVITPHLCTSFLSPTFHAFAGSKSTVRGSLGVILHFEF